MNTAGFCSAGHILVRYNQTHQTYSSTDKLRQKDFFIQLNFLLTNSFNHSGISKTQNTELRNNEISKTYLLQIVQIVICSIVIILYLPCNSSTWRTTAMDRTAAGEH